MSLQSQQQSIEEQLNEQQLRQEICRVGASLFNRGYTVGSAGNISVRLPDGWLITPTDACLGNLLPAQIAKVNLAGQWIDGEKPSKTLTLHRAIYDNNPLVNAVVHTHSTHLVSLSLSGVWQNNQILPPITPYQVMKVGRIPMIAYCRPGDPKVASQIAHLVQDVRGVLLERLGPVMWHQSISQAAYALEELEETARLWLMQNPKPSPLNAHEIDELCATFQCRW